MLCKRVIPCLDIKDGRVVKGINFVSLRDAGDPVEQASLYDRQGADEICFLDISASPEGKSTVVDVVRRTADCVFVPLTVGGGVRKVSDVRTLLEAGADKVAINSAAIRTPELISEAAKQFGTQAIVACVDAKLQPSGKYEVFSQGGRKPEGLDAILWCKQLADLGAGEILITSMDRDGTGLGYEVVLTRLIAEAVPIPVIASGGVGNLDHMVEGFVEGKADAVLAASIFHYGHHSIGEAKQHLRKHDIAVRFPFGSSIASSKASSR